MATPWPFPLRTFTVWNEIHTVQYSNRYYLGQTWHFLTSHNWNLLFPRCFQTFLPRFGLNHVPICLEVFPHTLWPHLFKYKVAWETMNNFDNLVRDWWLSPTIFGCSAFVLAKKLSHFLHELRKWAKKVFSLVLYRRIHFSLNTNHLTF